MFRIHKGQFYWEDAGVAQVQQIFGHAVAAGAVPRFLSTWFVSAGGAGGVKNVVDAGAVAVDVVVVVVDDDDDDDDDDDVWLLFCCVLVVAGL